MIPEVCSRCGRVIEEGQWAIDLDDDKARHEDCDEALVAVGPKQMELGL